MIERRDRRAFLDVDRQSGLLEAVGDRRLRRCYRNGFSGQSGELSRIRRERVN
jgi:hypothetical protein